MNLHHLPNLLCVFRIFLVLPVLLFLLDGRYGIAALLFGLAGFTDALDGFLARQFGWRSGLGAILDPVADKILAVATFVALAATGLVPAWLAALVIGRDLVIVTGGICYRFLIGPFEGEATVVSKVNTAMQLLLVLAVLGNAALGLPTQAVVLTLGAAVMVTAIVSGLDYVRTWSMLAMRQGLATETSHE